MSAARDAWWNECNVHDWFEAFTAHPRIGNVEDLKKVQTERGESRTRLCCSARGKPIYTHFFLTLLPSFYLFLIRQKFNNTQDLCSNEQSASMESSNEAIIAVSEERVDCLLISVATVGQRQRQ